MNRMYEVEFSGGRGDQVWSNTIKIPSSNIECALHHANEILFPEGLSDIVIYRVEEIDEMP